MRQGSAERTQGLAKNTVEPRLPLSLPSGKMTTQTFQIGYGLSPLPGSAWVFGS